MNLGRYELWKSLLSFSLNVQKKLVLVNHTLRTANKALSICKAHIILSAKIFVI